MNMRTLTVVGLTFSLVMACAYGSTYSIPQGAIDAQKVYYGKADAFNKPAEVDYEAIIKASPEYAQLKKEKAEKGSGKYWILLSQASDRAVRAIAAVGKESSYDFISSSGYLASLSPSIPAENITDLVISKINGKDKAEKAGTKDTKDTKEQLAKK